GSYDKLLFDGVQQFRDVGMQLIGDSLPIAHDPLAGRERLEPVALYKSGRQLRIRPKVIAGLNSAGELTRAPGEDYRGIGSAMRGNKVLQDGLHQIRSADAARPILLLCWHFVIEGVRKSAGMLASICLSQPN